MKTPQAIKRIFRALAALTILLDGVAFAQTWRSTLYPENWQRPNETTSFYNDKLIQDFSYAGYKSGTAVIPNTEVTHNAVTGYGADPSGTNDSTIAIQNAINAAQTAGGGVVYLPAGTYKVSIQSGQTHCLRISKSNVVLRGAGSASTFLFNTDTVMRSKAVVRISPSPSITYGSAVNITADLAGPTRRIPVASPNSFAVGDMVRIEWSFTAEWIAEHGQEAYWTETIDIQNPTAPDTAEYLRQVTAVNQTGGWIEVDVPTRYSIKTRENPVVKKLSGMISGSGIEGLSIGNAQHSGAGWGETDYSVAGKAAYDLHAAWLLSLYQSYDCWVSDVKSYKPSGNTTACHMPSNGISVNSCFRVTLKNCWMGRPQYGGGGGNGYMYRLQNSNDCLLQSCTADLSRHGFVISHAGTSGNVFLQCDDRNTKQAIGSGTPYSTNGSGSDNHMHFSHSNLWDSCHAHNSYYTAHHRTTSGTVPHGLTSAHAVYWNTSGSGTNYDDSANPIVRSEQGRYGYVIGTKATSGTAYFVSNPTGGNTAPADHVEGVNTGATLLPQSLYLDQLERRLRPVVTYKGNGSTGGSVPTDGNNPYTPGTTAAVLGNGSMVRTGYTFNGWNTMPDGSGTNYAATNAFTIDNHLTLYAKWTPATYLVTLNAQLGSGGSSSVSATYESGMPAAVAPTRGGYTFGGYYTQANGAGTQYYSATMTSTRNWDIAAATTLYAKWTWTGVQTLAGTLNSIDQIVGQSQSSGPALGYYPNKNNDLVGTGGSTTTSTRNSVNLVLGYTLPTLPVGTTVDTAQFKFEITDNRDHSNSDPVLNVHLLDVVSPDASGTTFYYTGAQGPNAAAIFAGSTYIDVSTTNVVYADDEKDQSYTLSGDVLSKLRSYYNGDHIPERSEVFFRFSLSALGDFETYIDRYKIDLAVDESALEITSTAPPTDPFGDWTALAGGGVTFSGDTNGDGVADGIAWLLDSASPTSRANPLLPTAQASSGALISNFRILKGPARGTALLKLQFSKDLGITDLWTTNTVTVPDTSSTVGGVDFVITPVSGEDYHNVQATIPASAAGGTGKVFTRLLAEP